MRKVNCKYCKWCEILRDDGAVKFVVCHLLPQPIEVGLYHWCSKGKRENRFLVWQAKLSTPKGGRNE